MGSKFTSSTDEWSIDMSTFKMLLTYFKLYPSVDCFASNINFKCKKFFSKIPQLDLSGVNFFTQDLLSNEVYWACPPPKLIIDVFKHVVKFDDVRMVLFTPVWKCSNYNWPYIVRGNFFHPVISKFKRSYPCFEANNSASNIFSGTKKFP